MSTKTCQIHHKSSSTTVWCSFVQNKMLFCFMVYWHQKDLTFMGLLTISRYMYWCDLDYLPSACDWLLLSLALSNQMYNFHSKINFKAQECLKWSKGNNDMLQAGCLHWGGAYIRNVDLKVLVQLTSFYEAYVGGRSDCLHWGGAYIRNNDRLISRSQCN